MKTLFPAVSLLTIVTTTSLAADIFIDFEDPNELANNWAQTYGGENTFLQAPGEGVGGSTGVIHFASPAGAQYVHFNYLTDVGPFQDGLSIYAKIHFVQVGVGNTVSIGFITDPAGIGSLSDNEVDTDWMGINLTGRSNFTEFRAELWGWDVGPEGKTLYRSGAGVPDSYVPIPDGKGGFADGVTPVDVWLGIELVLIDNGDGNWEAQSRIDVLSEDGSTVVIDDYAVYDYSSSVGVGSAAPELSGFSDFYNATSLYPMIGTQVGTQRNFGGADDITVTIPGESNDWYGYAVDELGWANTGTWMGWVNVASDPWIFSASLDKYVYAADDSGWVYTLK